MVHQFTSFVIFAEMRSGSNFLEANLEAFEEITCFGEAFNPVFIGTHRDRPILDINREKRDEDPLALFDAIRNLFGSLAGFRYFYDHDPRIFDEIIKDRCCAKVILTRNPVDTYVSLKIAYQTDEWRLGNSPKQKIAQVDFDAREFEKHLKTQQEFQLKVLNALQVSGQTAFYIGYDDIGNIDVINGLARYLGVAETRDRLNKVLKKQNPTPISEKVRNHEKMAQALARLDFFNLSDIPNFEPRRGPNVPSYIICPKSPLMFLPLSSGPVDEVISWMCAVDDVASDQLLTDLTQNEVKSWKRQQPNHRSFTVVRHPLLRAHEAFCQCILPVGDHRFAHLRESLINRYKLPLPPDGPDKAYDLATHKAAFSGFLTFLSRNLSGQTAIRVDPAWATQSQSIQGFAGFTMPDRIIRENEMHKELAQLADAIGIQAVPAIADPKGDQPYALVEIYDDKLEELARKAYQRDYVNLGFGSWA